MNKQQLISEIVDYVSEYNFNSIGNFKKDFEDFLKPRIDFYFPDKCLPIDEFNVSPEVWKEYLSKSDLK